MKIKTFTYFIIVLFCMGASIAFSQSHVINSRGKQYFREALKAAKLDKLKLAKSLLKESAKLNYPPALYALGYEYILKAKKFKDIPYKPALGLKLISKAAHLGLNPAQKKMIALQSKGFAGVSVNEVYAIRTKLKYRLKHTQNIKKKKTILLNLVTSYLFNYKPKLIDYDKGKFYLEKLLHYKIKGNFLKVTVIFASSILSKHYLVDDKPDLKQAIYWCKLGARLGDKQSVYTLSDYYRYGIGTRINLKKANKLLRQANQMPWPEYDSSHIKHTQSALFYLVLKTVAHNP